MQHNRLVELAIIGLEAEKARIDQELAALRTIGNRQEATPSRRINLSKQNRQLRGA